MKRCQWIWGARWLLRGEVVGSLPLASMTGRVQRSGRTLGALLRLSRGRHGVHSPLPSPSTQAVCRWSAFPRTCHLACGSLGSPVLGSRTPASRWPLPDPSGQSSQSATTAAVLRAGDMWKCCWPEVHQAGGVGAWSVPAGVRWCRVGCRWMPPTFWERCLSASPAGAGQGLWFLASWLRLSLHSGHGCRDFSR